MRLWLLREAGHKILVFNFLLVCLFMLTSGSRRENKQDLFVCLFVCFLLNSGRTQLQNEISLHITLWITTTCVGTNKA